MQKRKEEADKISSLKKEISFLKSLNKTIENQLFKTEMLLKDKNKENEELRNDIKRLKSIIFERTYMMYFIVYTYIYVCACYDAMSSSPTDYHTFIMNGLISAVLGFIDSWQSSIELKKERERALNKICSYTCIFYIIYWLTLRYYHIQDSVIIAIPATILNCLNLGKSIYYLIKYR